MECIAQNCPYKTKEKTIVNLHSKSTIVFLYSYKMCRLPTFPSPDPSPGRSMTRARRLYVSRPANFRSSDRPQIRGSAQGRALPPMRQGPFSPSCKKVNTCEDVSSGYRDTRPSCKKANSCEDSVFGPADGAFGTIVSSGEYRRSRDPERNTFRRRMNPAPQSRELERLVCSAS